MCGYCIPKGPKKCMYVCVCEAFWETCTTKTIETFPITTKEGASTKRVFVSIHDVRARTTSNPTSTAFTCSCDKCVFVANRFEKE